MLYKQPAEQTSGSRISPNLQIESRHLTATLGASGKWICYCESQCGAHVLFITIGNMTIRYWYVQTTDAAVASCMHLGFACMRHVGNSPIQEALFVSGCHISQLSVSQS